MDADALARATCSDSVLGPGAVCDGAAPGSFSEGGDMKERRFFESPLDALRYHVSGAIERGEGEAIVEQVGDVTLLDREARARFGGLSAGELEAMPTLGDSGFDDLKVDDGESRVWLSRCTVEDGEPFDHKVTVERIIDGRWVVAAVWEAPC